MRARSWRMLCVALVLVAVEAHAAKQKQAITFAQPANQAFSPAPLTLSATASSGLAVAFATRTKAVCTVSTNAVTFVTVGNCTIRASQPGNTLYAAAANVDRTFAIAKGTQTIAFGALADRVIGTSPFSVTGTATSGLTVSIMSLTPSICTIANRVVTLLALGICTLRATQAGNADYAAAPNADRTFRVVSVLIELQYLYDAVGNVVQIRRVVAGQP